MFFHGSFSSGYGVLNILHPLDGILGDFWQPTENGNMPCWLMTRVCHLVGDPYTYTWNPNDPCFKRKSAFFCSRMFLRQSTDPRCPLPFWYGPLPVTVTTRMITCLGSGIPNLTFTDSTVTGRGPYPTYHHKNHATLRSKITIWKPEKSVNLCFCKNNSVCQEKVHTKWAVYSLEMELKPL